MVEDGKVELDAPATRYLPWFTLDDPRAGSITVRHLLSHTSGIPASASLNGHQEPDALERRVRLLEWQKLQSAPGERFEYANDGFNVAGLIVQTVAGMPYEQVIAEKILKPLKLDRSTFDPARAAELGLAQGYVRRKGELRPQETRLTKAYNPSGMLLTTAEDAGRFLAAMASGGMLDGARILGADSFDTMWTPAAHVADNLEYGLGWYLSQQEGQRVVLHPGELLTMGSMFILLPERKLGVAVLANLDSDGKDEIAEGVARLLIGLEPVLRTVPQTGPENTFVPNRAVWDRYVGEYGTSQGTLRIFRDGDKLAGGIMSFGFELEPISDTQFVLHTEISSFDETVIELRPEADGSVSLTSRGSDSESSGHDPTRVAVADLLVPGPARRSPVRADRGGGAGGRGVRLRRVLPDGPRPADRRGRPPRGSAVGAVHRAGRRRRADLADQARGAGDERGVPQSGLAGEDGDHPGRDLAGAGDPRARGRWDEDEARRYGYPWPSVRERFERLEDALRICRAMFTQDRATIGGRHHQVHDALNVPRPIQPGGPKILVGGGGERRTLRLAAQYADACNIFGSIDDVRHKMGVLDQHCREIGRDPREIARTRLGMLLIAPTADEAGRLLDETVARLPSPLPKEQLRRLILAGDPASVAEQARAHLDAGLDGLIFSFPHGVMPDQVMLAGRTLNGVLGTR